MLIYKIINYKNKELKVILFIKTLEQLLNGNYWIAL